MQNLGASIPPAGYIAVSKKKKKRGDIGTRSFAETFFPRAYFGGVIP